MTSAPSPHPRAEGPGLLQAALPQQLRGGGHADDPDPDEPGGQPIAGIFRRRQGRRESCPSCLVLTRARASALG